MKSPTKSPAPVVVSSRLANFRRFLLRGLAVILPPVLTIVILIWVARTVNLYVVEPIASVIQWGLEALPGWIPGMESGEELIAPWAVTLAAALLLIISLYFLGRFLALRLGQVIWQSFEARTVSRLPLVRNVYASVKQVTDFLFSEREQIQYRNVVAVEYPRKGIWSLGLATGESLQDLWNAAGEDMVSVLIPSSPMPVTGYTINVPRSEVVDLDITVDQAFQFCISCGVVVPQHQLPRLAAKNREATAAMAPASDSRSPAATPEPAKADNPE